MKKLRLLFALIVASICSVHSAWADRVAPELPEAQALVSGTSYYLYNVMEGKFACRSTTSYDYAALGTYGDKVTITATENEGEYTIRWASNNYYWLGYDTYINSYSTSIYGDVDYFTISVSSKGYTIQRSPRNTWYYKADEFIGYDGSNGDRLTPALAEGSIHWQLIDVDDAEYYFAKHKLYTYLNVADQYNFYITQYEQVYNNPTSTTAELDQAQSTLKNALELSQNYVSPEWTEYPILFQNTTDEKWTNNYSQLSWYTYSDGTVKTTTLAATVNVDNDATMAYYFWSDSWNINLRVYLDGELIQNISSNQAITWYYGGNGSNYTDARRYYIEMTPGKHDIAWTCVCNDASLNNYNYCHISDIGIQNTPTIRPATTTVEGQLGTEVLKLTDPISKVKKIVINGIIGDDDWATIGLMKGVFSIDMSGATAANIPAEMFTKEKYPFLHSVKLPQGLTAIGDYAFYKSDIEGDIVFPTTLTSIGGSAFAYTKITGAFMSDGITEIGAGAFGSCRFLENVTYPTTVNYIPDYCFDYSFNLRTFDIHDGVTSIGRSAFSDSWLINPRFPESVKTIGSIAFYNTAADSLFITENMTVDYNAFGNCGNLVYAEWPTKYVTNNGTVVPYCPKLNKVVLKSPTVVANASDFLYGNTLGDITLLVPDFIVTAYKLDPYWYQCNVQGFNSADITDWQVTRPLVLNPGQRIGGTPNLNFCDQSQLTVNGDDVQTIGNMSIEFCPYMIYYNYTSFLNYNFMLSYTNNVNITGELSEDVITQGGRWYFQTLPFDMKVGDIIATALETGATASYAIRYYDGAGRAEHGTGGNWKNYTADDIIPAGTGFIYQTARDARSKFVAQNNASKQYILSNNEFVKALEENPSDVTANKGWNLVGNPWQTYYNIHKLNFTAPITVMSYDNYWGNYEAYSIIDDDYAIKPLEAIFVQCPEDVNSISFPIDGRQLTNVIESQNGARADQPSERKLIDVVLSDGEMTDKTRFVLNPKASLNYETNCDASKFMSMNAAVPQIYTIEQGTQMAINERPLAEGTVQIGFRVAQGGTYTISAPRNQFKSITLVDTETGIETDLTNSDYTFNANAGQNDNRFVLRVSGAAITSIESLNTQQSTPNEYYNLNGQRITAPQKGLFIVNGKKVIK